MKKTGIILTAVALVCVVLAVCLIWNGNRGKIKEDNGTEKVSGEDGQAAETTPSITSQAKESKKLSAAEVKKYQEDCIAYVKANMENNDNVTNQVLESIEAEFADVREVTPDNYAESESFYQFAIHCTYLDTYLEEDTPGDQAGIVGFKYIKKVLQHQKGYQTALDDFQDFYSLNIEELYDHCYYTGIYVVGKSRINKGEYVLFTDNPDGTDFKIFQDADSNKILQQETLFYDVIITLNDGERLELGENCKAVPIEDADYIDEEEGTMFKAGYHIDAGTCSLTAKGEGTYRVVTDLRAQDDAEAVSFTGNTEVAIKDGEYLKLEDCHILEEEEEE